MRCSSRLLNTVKSHFEMEKRKLHVKMACGLDVNVVKGQGVQVWDRHGKDYLDFIGGVGALSLGHCHPKLIAAINEQIGVLHLTTHMLENPFLHAFSCYATQTFKFDRIITANSGCEAVELGIKLARLWGYRVKKICPKDAIVVVPNNNYFGTSIASISASQDNLLFSGFEPLVKGLKMVPWDDVCALEEVLKNPNVAGFLAEPIASEGNVLVPTPGYLQEIRRLCCQNKVLWIANEVRTGLGRTGKMLAVDHECVQPDLLVLGKSLSGGYYPISALLGSSEILELLRPGSQVSAYAGNPLGAAIALKTVQIIKDDNLPENAECMGALFRDALLCALDSDDMPMLKHKGLLFAIKIDPRIGSSHEVVEALKDCGLLCTPCKEGQVCFCPPLVVSEGQINAAVAIIKKVVDYMKGDTKFC